MDAYGLFSVGYIQGFWRMRSDNMKWESYVVDSAFMLSRGAGNTEFLKAYDKLTHLMYEVDDPLPPPAPRPPVSEEELRAEECDATLQGHTRGCLNTPSCVGVRTISQEELRAERCDAALQGHTRGYLNVPSWMGVRVSRERTLAKLRSPQIVQTALSLAQKWVYEHQKCD